MDGLTFGFGGVFSARRKISSRFLSASELVMTSTLALPEPQTSLSDFPDHAKALGMITATWGAVEDVLASIFSLILRATPWRAQYAYYAVFNNDTRVQMIQSTAKAMVGRDAFGKRLDNLLVETRDLANIRNKFVHALWTTQDGKLYVVERKSATVDDFPHGKKRECHAQELVEALERIVTIRGNLDAFATEYSKAFPMSFRASDSPPPKSLLGK